MGSMSRIRARFRLAVRNFAMLLIGAQVSTPGGLIRADAERSITDGVDYSLPVMLPEYLRRSMSPDAQNAYLQESTRTSFQFQFDSPNRSAADNPITMPVEDPLREWDHGTREQVLTNCHAAYQRNPLAHRGVNYMASFVVGDGFSLSCRNKQVDEWLTAFIDNPDNDIRAYERQAAIDLQVDGELFLRYYDGSENTSTRGQVVVVPQRPWECTYIKTEKGFFRRPDAYHFERIVSRGDDPTGSEPQAAEDVPGDEILHIAVNRHAYELRGRPDLYPILPWLRAYKEWLEDRARQNARRGTLLWDVAVTAGGAPNAISSVMARWSRPPTSGSVYVHSDKEKVSAVENAVNADAASEDGRQMKMMVAVGLGLPEYFLSDGANANMATTKSQTLPAMMTFQDYQRLLIEKLWYPMFRRVLQAAIDANILPPMVDEEDADGDPLYEELAPDADEDAPRVIRKINTLDAYDVAYQPIGDKEPFTLAQALAIASSNGWVSDETATTEMGFDYGIEQKRRKREQAEGANDMARGNIPTPPGVTPPGFTSNGVEEEPAEETPEDALQQTPA